VKASPELASPWLWPPHLLLVPYELQLRRNESRYLSITPPLPAGCERRCCYHPHTVANRRPLRSNSPANSSSTIFLSMATTARLAAFPHRTGTHSRVPSLRLAETAESASASADHSSLCDLAISLSLLDPGETSPNPYPPPAIAFGDMTLRLFPPPDRPSAQGEPVSVIGKPPVPPALQHLHHPLPGYRVYHRRDSKLPPPPSGFGVPPASPLRL